MANDYFNHATNRIAQGTLARAAQVNAIGDEIVAGFDHLPAEAEIKQNRVGYAGADTGVADAYVVSMPYTLTSYVAGLMFEFIPQNTNTGASTINVDGVGAVAITDIGGNAILAGDLQAGALYRIQYNGTSFVVHSAYGDKLASAASAAAALVSENNAAASAAAASVSEGNAATSASSAAADLIQTNADVVSTNADVVSTNADVASTNADVVSSAASAAAALVSEGNAATSAGAASTSENNAAASAGAASTSETNTAASETAAAGSASAASTSAGNAAASAGAASTSETNAAASDAAAAAWLADFETKYLGAAATPPTLDLVGGALIDGALYWDTTTNLMMAYDLGNTVWTNAANGAVLLTQKGAIDGVATLSSDQTLIEDFGGQARAKEILDGMGTALLIPMYQYPSPDIWTDPDFNAIITSAKENPNVAHHVIINPSSGPGTVQDLTWLRAIRRLRGAGCYVHGYVSTNYSATSYATVTADVDYWKSLYGPIDGIFFDEMSNADTQTDRDLYKSYRDYSRSVGMRTAIGNPGTTVPVSYFQQEVMDVIITSEGASYPLESIYQGDWADSYMEVNKSKRGALVYAQSTLDKTSFDLISKYNGFVYVTSGLLADPGGPWATLPTYLSDMVSTVSPASVTVGTTAPASPAEGDQWLDTSGTNPVLNIYNATAVAWQDSGLTALANGQAGMPQVLKAKGRLIAATTITSSGTHVLNASTKTSVALLVGGGGGGGAGYNGTQGQGGRGGAVMTSSVTRTGGESLTVTIGSGGGGATSTGYGTTGGTTSLTGHTSAVGGYGGGSRTALNAPEPGSSSAGGAGAPGAYNSVGGSAPANGGGGGGGGNAPATTARAGGAGGSGKIIIWEFA